MPRLATTIAVALTGANLASAGCTFRWWAEEGDTCASMASDWEITKADFIKWNPSVGADCANGLVTGNDYCVEFKEGVEEPTKTTTSVQPTYTGGVPRPTQSGLAKDCNDYYNAKQGDTCGKIVDLYGDAFTLQDFYKWNPSVESDCSLLYAGYWYCVSVRDTDTTTTTTTTTTTVNPTATTTMATTTKPTATSIPPKPSPTQAGLTEDCKEFYKVEAGDYCYKILEKYGNRFTLSDL
jgi:hypothetical protein